MHPMMAAMMAHHDDEDRPKLAPDVERLRLRDSLAAYLTPHTFRVGDLVRQKPQAKTYRPFGDHDQAIVVQVVATPELVNTGAPSQYEIQDLVVGCHSGPDRDFSLHHVDSRRFEPVPEDDA